MPLSEPSACLYLNRARLCRPFMGSRFFMPLQRSKYTDRKHLPQNQTSDSRNGNPTHSAVGYDFLNDLCGLIRRVGTWVLWSPRVFLPDEAFLWFDASSTGVMASRILMPWDQGFSYGPLARALSSSKGSGSQLWRWFVI